MFRRVDGADFLSCPRQFGSVPTAIPAANPMPEPAAAILLLMGYGCVVLKRRGMMRGKPLGIR